MFIQDLKNLPNFIKLSILILIISTILLFPIYEWITSIKYGGIIYTYSMILLSMIPMFHFIIKNNKKWKK